MADSKQVKVDNWGVYFLQRLKHFFNRTDYCDLTLQFQDNAQLKVHRLVLNACTEYFELLERTCEMYEDCLIMPDDLQADVVVPIINFMYTGHLEYKPDLLEKLYQTAQIMNMSVLTKLLDAQRNALQQPAVRASQKQIITKHSTYQPKNKRSYSNAFEPIKAPAPAPVKRVYIPAKKEALVNDNNIVEVYRKGPNKKKYQPEVARPTRYEAPEGIADDEIIDDSFTDISYESRPLMVHPLVKQEKESMDYGGLFSEPSSSKKFGPMKKKNQSTTSDMVEFRKLPNNHVYDPFEYARNDNESYETIAGEQNQTFENVIDSGTRVTIETKTSKTENIDHAKIISEVLKKYPHLVQNRKNIKLKIVNPTTKKIGNKKMTKPEPENENDEVYGRDYTYESGILDTKEAAKLVAMGVENVKGPWLCLICGTPGKALNFVSYYKFRMHLVEAHKEKAPANMCEYCGLKSGKRNHLLHHLYTKHGVPPPPAYKFPKCNQCSYIALTEAFLIKHKMTHLEMRTFTCNVCHDRFKNSALLLNHIQTTGHKISPDRKANLQCIYCMKHFLREGNLYAHLKASHREVARKDGIIDDSGDEEISPMQGLHQANIKYEIEEENESDQYQIQHEDDGNLQLMTKKIFTKKPVLKQTILNKGISVTAKPAKQMQKMLKMPDTESVYSGENESGNDENASTTDEMMVLHEEQEENLQDNHEYVISDMLDGHQVLQQSVNQPNLITEKVIDPMQPTKKNIQYVVSSQNIIANPPIIFSDQTQTKTLSVLTNSTSVDPSNIQIQDSQSGNVMILQDNYPITTSTAGNSKIVVLYSHPLDDGNKHIMQYGMPQIVSSDSVPQFLQSSTIMAQNFSTITTSVAPIISEEVETQQSANQWQGNIQNIVENTIQLNGNHGIQGTLISNQQVPVEIEVPSTSTNVEHDLAEIQVVQQIPEELVTQEVVSEVTLHQQENNVIEAVTTEQCEESLEMDQTEIPDEAQTETLIAENSNEEIASLQNIGMIENTDIIVNDNQIETTEFRDDNSLAVIQQISEENTVAENVAVEHISEEHTVEDTEPEMTDSNLPVDIQENEISANKETPEAEVSTQLEVEQNAVVVEENSNEENVSITVLTSEVEEAEDQEEREECVEDQTIESTDEEQIQSKTNEMETESQSSTANNEMVNTDNEVEGACTASNQIQHLTSEWSEDEEIVHNSEVVNESANEQLVPSAKTPEVEESIENIQQEMQQQENNARIETISANQALIETPVEIYQRPEENETPELDVRMAEHDTETLENDVEMTEGDVETPQEIIDQADVVSEPLETEEHENGQMLHKVNGIKDTSKSQDLSLILNDWDDNESQDSGRTEDISAPIDGQNEVELTAGANTEQSLEQELPNLGQDDVAEEVLEQEVPSVDVVAPKDDNIKKLVSDWDEDEE